MDKWVNQPMSIQRALIHGKESLVEQTDGLCAAEILLQYTLKVARAYLYAHTEQTLSLDQIARYQDLLQQRQQGTPIAYLIGQRSFWTLDLIVSPHTLIPRPETELLIERMLAETDAKQPYTLLDLGTGSGAIALAIASERPDWHITACDQSAEALQIAEHNAQALQLTTIQFIRSDWFQALDQQQFDIIVSNPPYLASDDPHLLQGDLRFEPQSALVSGKDGLDALRIIIQNSCHHLSERGLLIVEHGYAQGAAVYKLFEQYGYQNIQSWQDWQEHDRICSGRKKVEVREDFETHLPSG